jgi:thiamine pyrophosphokinase
MRAAVITGGAAPSADHARRWLESCNLIVAADSGLEVSQRWQREPDYIVGDMDSIAPPLSLSDFPNATIRRFEAEKDETDTELAIRIAREAGCDRVVLLGGGGGRLDHLLAIVSLFDRADPPEAWITDREVVRCVEAELDLDTHIGETISVFPVGTGPWDMQSQGLQWPLDPLHWDRGDVGISNIATESRVRIRVVLGRLIVIRALGGSFADE